MCFVFFRGVSQLVHEDNCIKISNEGLSLVINSLFSSVFPDILVRLSSPTLVELPGLPVLALGSDPARVLGAVLVCLSFLLGRTPGFQLLLSYLLWFPLPKFCGFGRRFSGSIQVNSALWFYRVRVQSSKDEFDIEIGTNNNIIRYFCNSLQTYSNNLAVLSALHSDCSVL